MAPDQHLKIINPVYYTDVSVFSQFQKLPAELRQAIWRLSVERHRLLEVKIQGVPDSKGHPSPCAANVGSYEVVSDTRYSITIRGFGLHSKLFGVTRESRKIALEFYRVHLPCAFRTAHKEARQNLVQGLLYFNPDNDFVRPFADQSEMRLVMDFIRDLKAHDPHRLGLVNMAMNHEDVNDWLYLAHTGDPYTKKILADTLSHSREIIWMLNSATGRGIIGPMQGFQPFFASNGVGVRFNHSMPIRPMALAFDLLEKDPRAVTSELQFVATAAGDPRQMRIQWQELVNECGISKNKEPRMQVLFAYDATSGEQRIIDSKTAKQFLKDEEDTWIGLQQRWSRTVIKHAGKVPIEGPQELAEATRPAIGFWLFPAEAFGDVEGDVSGMKKVFDLREHWPKLALSYLQ